MSETPHTIAELRELVERGREAHDTMRVMYSERLRELEALKSDLASLRARLAASERDTERLDWLSNRAEVQVWDNRHAPSVAYSRWAYTTSTAPELRTLRALIDNATQRLAVARSVPVRDATPTETGA